jgi:ArsR family transcriptional regulator, arsenate/arsenite/antimonite-responsive transcriptional repressor
MVVKLSKSTLRTESFFKAISDPTRRRILKLLKKRSMTAGEIAEVFSITMGSLSHHYNVLKAADLVRAERRGQQIVYSINTSVFEDAAALMAELFHIERPEEEAS